MLIKFRETRQLLRGNRKELVQFSVGSVHKAEPDMSHFVLEGSAVEHVVEHEAVVEEAPKAPKTKRA